MPRALAASAAARAKGCSVPLAPPLANERTAEIVLICGALADPTRVEIVHSLAAAHQPLCVCDFVAALGLSQPTISHHLARLRRAGIVESVRDRVWTFYFLNPSMSAAARSLLAHIG